ncbi:MAG: TSCPD domain-containing protein [Planctomycetota bacterium]
MPRGEGRQGMPITRKSVTHKFAVAGHEGYLTVGLFEDGQPGEIFIKMSKEGSTLSGLIQGFCRAFSLALQYGLPLCDAVDRFRGMRFDPMGPTNNPAIPEASSILDYVARYLEHRFLTVASEAGTGDADDLPRRTNTNRRQ